MKLLSISSALLSASVVAGSRAIGVTTSYEDHEEQERALRNKFDWRDPKSCIPSDTPSAYELTKQELRNEIDDAVPPLIEGVPFTTTLDEILAFRVDWFFNQFFNPSPDTSTFGRNGEYTDLVASTVDVVQKFWSSTELSPNFDEVTFLRVTGGILSSDPVSLAVLQGLATGVGLDPAGVEPVVLSIENYVPGGNANPLFSDQFFYLNVGTGGQFQPTIALGDGALEIEEMRAKRLSIDAETLFVWGLGFGLSYYISQLIGRYPFPSVDITSGNFTLTPEENRETLYMSFLFTCYYFAHKKGGGYGTTGEDICLLQERIFSVARCDSEPLGAQRVCACAWAANLATDAKNTIHDPTELAAAFDEVRDGIEAVDKGVCPTPKCEFFKKGFDPSPKKKSPPKKKKKKRPLEKKRPSKKKKPSKGKSKKRSKAKRLSKTKRASKNKGSKH